MPFFFMAQLFIALFFAEGYAVYCVKTVSLRNGVIKRSAYCYSFLEVDECILSQFWHVETDATSTPKNVSLAYF